MLEKKLIRLRPSYRNKFIADEYRILIPGGRYQATFRMINGVD
ncbi:MAG: hypothetical protein ACM3UW_03440 [Bacillota bacterium]